VTAAGRLARRFVSGETDPAETAVVVRALLQLDPPDRPEPVDESDPGAHQGALAAVEQWAAELDRQDRDEHRRAAELLAALDELSEQARRLTVEGDPRYHIWPLVDLLRERSLAAGPHRPERSRELARLAVAAAERVPSGAESEALRADLTALTYAQLGNAERVVGDFRAADGAFAEALAALARGTRDPVTRARVTGLLASLRTDQSQFDEALRLTRRTLRLYRRAGDRHGRGRTLIKLARIHAYRDELDAACAVLDEAVAHLDPAQEPRLLVVAHHNRASYLERTGRLDEAVRELEAAGELAEARFDRVRVRWVQGRVALRRGETEAAEAALVETRRAFLEEGLGYETAQVSLELAALYAEQGRAADQRRLAEEMVPLFEARDVHPEARAALALFCDAARREMAPAALAREIASYLDRARESPRLAFRHSES
jgi:tetratricopeptide (TPR) repeat protein